MKTLYLQNYKGFSEAFLPFQDVNFFVGENSTGKTAILNLLKLISGPAFWFDPDFNCDDVELGFFSEIINQSATKIKCFKIGINFNVEKKDGNNNMYSLFTFINKNGIPKISYYKTTIDSKTVLAHICEKTVRYKVKSFTNEVFDEWVKDDKFDDNYRTLSLPREAKELPFGVINNILHMQVQGGIDKIPDKKKLSISINTVFDRLIWCAPIRAKVKRTYDGFKQKYSPEGEHIPALLKAIFQEKDKVKQKSIITILEKFGSDSSLFDKIRVKTLGKGVGVPFEIDLVYGKTIANITNVGYGISQILPLLIEILTSKNDFFALQQPEVHLHPRAQAAFGEFILNSYLSNHNKFIIETHSDYTIDRFRYSLGTSKNESKPTSQIVFFERNSIGTKLSCIPIQKSGAYSEVQPDSFKQFFIDEELKMLSL